MDNRAEHLKMLEDLQLRVAKHQAVKDAEIKELQKAVLFYGCHTFFAYLCCLILIWLHLT